jgi:hypothetical protein
VLTIRLIGDNPANETAIDQRLELGFMDTVLILIAPDRGLLTNNDDAEDEENTTNSLIEGLVLPVDGIHRIESRSYADLNAGAYTLVIEPVGNGKR